MSVLGVSRFRRKDLWRPITAIAATPPLTDVLFPNKLPDTDYNGHSQQTFKQHMLDMCYLLHNMLHILCGGNPVKSCLSAFKACERLKPVFQIT